MSFTHSDKLSGIPARSGDFCCAIRARRDVRVKAPDVDVVMEYLPLAVLDQMEHPAPCLYAPIFRLTQYQRCDAIPAI